MISDPLQTFLQNIQKSKQHQTNYNVKNLNSSRDEFSKNKPKLKSDLKKCTAFVNKVRCLNNLNAQGLEALKTEIEVLNLTRYLDEIVTSMTTVDSFKLADVGAMLEISEALHTKYPEFVELVLEQQRRFWKPKVLAKADPKSKRINTTYLLQLIERGVIPSNEGTFRLLDKALGGALFDGKQQPDGVVLVQFAKVGGYQVTGCIPRSARESYDACVRLIDARTTGSTEPDNKESGTQLDKHEVDDIKQLVQEYNDSNSLPPPALPEDQCQQVRNFFQEKYDQFCQQYQTVHEKYSKYKKRCDADRLLAGALSEDREKSLNQAQKLYEQIGKAVETLSETLDRPLPSIKIDEENDVHEENTTLEVYKEDRAGVDDQNEGIWEDEEMKSFYIDVPDFLSVIPQGLLGLSDADIESKIAANLQKYRSGQTLSVEDGENLLEPDVTGQLPTIEKEESEDMEIVDPITDEDVENVDESDTPHFKFMALLETLPNCNRRELSDEFAEKFLTQFGSVKNNRKRLAKTLYLVPRNRIDLLPQYGRIVSILDRVYDDIASNLLQDLEAQFHGLAKHKKNQFLDKRLINARFLSELTKFGVAPPIVILKCMKRCMEELSGNNIDVLCCIFESCGRYLFRSPHTKPRMESNIEILKRLRKIRNWDERVNAIVDSAIFIVQPPTMTGRTLQKVKQYNPIESYLRHLLMDKLDENNVAHVYKQILRLPWNGHKKLAVEEKRTHDTTMAEEKNVETQDESAAAAATATDEGLPVEESSKSSTNENADKKQVMWKDEPIDDCGLLVTKVVLKAAVRSRYSAPKNLASVLQSIRRHRPEVAVRSIDAVIEYICSSIERPSFRDQQRTVCIVRLLGEMYKAGVVPPSLIFWILYRFIDYGHDIPQKLRDISNTMNQSNVNRQNVEPLQESMMKLDIKDTVIQEDEELLEEEVEETKSNVEQKNDDEPINPVAVSQYSKYDPRVYSPIDPPNSFFRVKLVCVLLEVTAPSLISSSPGGSGGASKANSESLAKLQVFLTAFQRYLFVKGALPTEVEFAILDAFDLIDSNLKLVKKSSFKRYNSWQDAHNATVAVEEKEFLDQSKLQARLVSQGSDLMDDVTSVATEEDEEEEEEETESLISETAALLSDDAETSSSSEIESDWEEGYGSSDSSNSIDEDDSDEDDDDESQSRSDDEELEESEEDEDARMRRFEEEAFEREVRKLTMEAMEKGKLTARAGPGGKVSDTMVPASQYVSKKQTDISLTTSQVEAGMKFNLLKRGHKGRVEIKQLFIPTETNLAKQAMKQDDEGAKEREMLKARVLQYEKESREAEQLSSMMSGDEHGGIGHSNKPHTKTLSFEVIERNFGRSSTAGSSHSDNHHHYHRERREGGGRGGRGRGSGRGGGGRSLAHF